MSAADPAQAFGQQPPPSPIVAHHLLCASSPLAAPKLPHWKLPACTSCALAWLKKDQTNRSVQKCTSKVSYKMGGKNNKEVSPWPTVQVHNKKCYKRSRTSTTNPTIPLKTEAMQAWSASRYRRDSWNHCPQIEAICRHTNCFRKLKYICSDNLALMPLFKSYQKLIRDNFFLWFFGVGFFLIFMPHENEPTSTL